MELLSETHHFSNGRSNGAPPASNCALPTVQVTTSTAHHVRIRHRSEPDPDNLGNLYAWYWAYVRDALIATDTKTGLLLDVNPATVDLTGFSREELVGNHFSTLHSVHERPRAESDFRNAATRPIDCNLYHLRRKDGSCLPIMVSASAPMQIGNTSLIVATLRDITDLQQNERRLAAQNWALSAYASAAFALGQASHPEGLLQAICAAITSGPAYTMAWVGIAEDGPSSPIRVAAAVGNNQEYVANLSLSWSADARAGCGPTGIAIRTGLPQIVEDFSASLPYREQREQAKQAGIRSSISIPFRIAGRSRGALVVYTPFSEAFEASAINVFQHLADQIEHGLHALEQGEHLHAEQVQREKSQTQLAEALSATVAAIATAMEKRDSYTAGHQRRVAHIAHAIGVEMGWQEERLQGLRMAAVVHDIGKIGIPVELLNKSTPLSNAEYEQIRRHPEIGYEILKDIPFPWPIADIVRQHHEKLDGSGYPLGLTADAILPESKVLAVADILESMASDRPYRAAHGLDAALAEIERQSGYQLDREAVKACMSLFRDKNFAMP
jgi:PAS domain S-box-containing protein